MIALSEGISEANLLEVYSDPYILRVGHDHRPAAPIYHSAVTYLSAWINDSFAGAFMFIRFSPIEYEMHALLFKSSVWHSRELGHMALDWAFEQPIERVTGYIIEDLGSALNYGKKIGFKVEGFRRNACLKDGELIGVWVLGMTREDWRDA